MPLVITGICFAVTYTFIVALYPLNVVTVIFAEPSLTAVIIPALLTVATCVLSEDHLTVLFVALAGLTVAVIFSVFPSSNITEVLSTEIPVGLIILGFSATVTFTVAVNPLTVLAVITAEPFPTPVIRPPLTVATELLLDDHETVLYVAFAGLTVAVTASTFPSNNDTEVLFNFMLVGFTTFILIG